MNLYNPTPVPSGLRRCYWDADYIASQPFCITSKLTEIELIALAAYEEAAFWLSIEQIKKGLSNQARNELDESLEEISNDRAIDSKKVVDLYLASPKKFYFCGFKKSLKGLGCCNTQTKAGLPAKTNIKRSDFINR
jgi:hypothetical protein